MSRITKNKVKLYFKESPEGDYEELELLFRPPSSEFEPIPIPGDIEAVHGELNDLKEKLSKLGCQVTLSFNDVGHKPLQRAYSFDFPDGKSLKYLMESWDGVTWTSVKKL